MLAKVLRRILPSCIRPIGYLTALTKRRTNTCVRLGPFAGMKYASHAQGSAYIPKLLGIYERELKDVVARICEKSPDHIVDIGAAEGYYAVGLARLLPATIVTAFEMEPLGRLALEEMASLNAVTQRIRIRGKCEVADLVEALSGSSNVVVVCDVEGYEEKLLDPSQVNALSSASILVELHDFILPGITGMLQDRFGSTHIIEHILEEDRSPAEFPWRTFGTMLLPKAYLRWAVSEWRPVRMAWLWMEPK